MPFESPFAALGAAIDRLFLGMYAFSQSSDVLRVFTAAVRLLP